MIKRYTLDAIGIVLGICKNPHNPERSLIGFDDCMVNVPQHIADAVKVGDNVHIYRIDDDNIRYWVIEHV